MTTFPFQMLRPIVLVALFGAYAVWSMKKRKAGMGPAFRMFFERIGYRHAEIPDAPSCICGGGCDTGNGRRCVAGEWTTAEC
jgi:hypothetical protein